jgi:hypothetical protein
MAEHYEQEWFQAVQRVEARRGAGRNKLRTYRSTVCSNVTWSLKAM